MKGFSLSRAFAVRMVEIALQKKLEVKDELSKELASKSDLALVESKIDKKITIWSVIILCAIIILNRDSILLIAQLLGAVK